VPTTTTKGWPYPLGGDPPDVPNAMLALAQLMDDRLPYLCAFGRSVITASGLATGTAATLAVTLPVGRFSFPPVMSATMSGISGGSAFVVPRVSGVTASGFSLSLFNAGATAATFTSQQVDWTATQMLTTTGGG
jgi:hypothetical protein